MEEEKVLHVNMLGGFSIEYEEKPISFGKRSQSRFMQLFQILVLRREGVSKDKLIEALYDWEDMGTKNSSLNNLIYHMRRQLVAAGLPEEEYVEVKKGICTWSGSMKLITDVSEFKALYEKACQAEASKEKEALLTQMCELYRGEFLPQLANETWVIVESVHLKKIYEDCVRELGGLLKEKREYLKMYRIYSAAAELYPFEEWQIYQIDSLMMMERYEEAYELYNDTVKRYSEELGLPPSQQMLDSFQAMREKLIKVEENFHEIRKHLEEHTERKGAYFCGYPSFVDTYRVLCRMTDRIGQSVFLMCCTLSQLKKSREKRNSRQVNAWLKEVIGSCVRQGDLFTRYSKNQYLILLLGMHWEDSDIIIDRIRSGFFKNEGTAGYHLDFSVSSALGPFFPPNEAQKNGMPINGMEAGTKRKDGQMSEERRIG